MREQDLVREKLHDDPFTSNEDYGKMIEDAANADEARELELERDEQESA